MIEQAIGRPLLVGAAGLAAFLLCLALIVVLRPWLARRSLARPNARSSHRVPTPQGGGIAVVTATFVVAWVGIALWPSFAQSQGSQFLALTTAAALLGVVGAVDDSRPLPEVSRLLLQFAAAGGVIARCPTPGTRCRSCRGRSSERSCFSAGFGSSTSSISWMASIG